MGGLSYFRGDWVKNMPPEKVKEINDQVVSELIKEMRNCSSCGCTGIIERVYLSG